MPVKSQYELDREANIAKNRALFEDLGLKEAVTSLGSSKPSKSTAKPVQPKKLKREREIEAPRRQSTRLLSKQHPPANETPRERKIREAEQKKELAELEAARLEAQEKDRAAKRPRHDVLNFKTLWETNQPQELSKLSTTMESVAQLSGNRPVGDPEAFDFKDEAKHNAEVKLLREKVQNLKVIARAKVTMDRVYCAAYHPEIEKDLIFFGDKQGQLGIWDARAPSDEVDDDDESDDSAHKERGKYWRLQLHWPANSKSSISSIKFDPIDSHNLYTTSYDCTIRSLSFVSGTSAEVYAAEDGTLISSLDMPPTGQEMWISDVEGGVIHLDLREKKTNPRRYLLSENKIGCISVNPTRPEFLLTASNDRYLKIWDARKLSNIPIKRLGKAERSEDDGVRRHTVDFDSAIVNEHLNSALGKGGLRGEWKHDKSASSAYWDPRGRQIVSTSYDDTLRLWEIENQAFKSDDPFSTITPFCRIKHSCQTGKWLTILRAQWSPNPDAYPHFTVGNMNHSLDIYSSKGDLITKLSDGTMISAVQAVTCSHPRIIERAASGNASGRCILWGPAELE